MAVRLTIAEEGDPHSLYERTFLFDRIVIGRARSSDVCLPDMAVSTRHAEIRVSENDYVIVDLESVNGTTVEEKPLLPFRQRTLKNGDVIAIANFQITFQLGATVGREEPRDASVIQAREMLANVLARSGASLDSRNLVVVSGNRRASRFPLPASGTLIIGRGRDADIELDDRSVSRKHARIAVDDTGIAVRDLGGRRGVIVNGQQVEDAMLAPGDRFTVGKTTLALEHPADRSLGVIFDAPEEDTSISRVTESSAVTSAAAEDTALPPEPDEPSLPPGVEPGESAKTGAETPPPVGPADPLVSDSAPETPSPEGAPSERPARDNTDIGLILIGAVIVLAAVAGLVYLYS